jgi:hypothetical protein
MKNIYKNSVWSKILKLSVIFILLSLQTNVYAQNGIIWQKCFGVPSGSNDYRNMCKTDGGYFLVGGSYNGGDFVGNYGLVDIGLIKIDNNGNKLWSNHYGGTGADRCYSITKGWSGRYYIVGSTASNNLPNYTGSGINGYIVCIDSLGNMLWQNCYGVLGGEEFYTAVEPYGNYLYAAGNTQSLTTATGSAWSYGFDDFYVCKIDAMNGSLVKAQHYGGSNHDYVRKMIRTQDNNLLLVGTSQSNNFDVPVNYGTMSQYDAWALKIDTGLNIITNKIFGGISGDEFHDVLQVDNGFVLFGYTHNQDTLTGNLDIIVNGNFQMMLIKTDNNLNSLWQKSYGCSILTYSTADSWGSGGNLLILLDNGFLMSAFSNPTYCNAYPITTGYSVFIKTDFAGNQMAERYYGNISYGGQDFNVRSIINAGDGIVVGANGKADNNYFCNSTGVNPAAFWNIYKWNDNLIVGNEEKAGKENMVEVYPSPATSALIIDGLTNTALVEIYDISGKLLLTKQLNTQQLDISLLAKGLYFIKLTTEEGSVVRKFVKE